MTKFRIDVVTGSVLSDAPRRMATWIGELNWSAPLVGGTWFHCGDWTGETFDRVAHQGPHKNGEEGNPDIALEVIVSDEVMGHLVEDHGFVE